MIRFIALLLCCAPACHALAQQMYKTVGPDGKITFSDRPAIDAKTRVSVMESYTLRPAPEPAPKAALPKPAAVAVPLAPPTVVSPEVEKAMVAIMSLMQFGRRFDAYCAAVEPDGKTFPAAIEGWKQRNAAALEQQKRLLTEVISPNRRAQMLDKAQQVVELAVSKAAVHQGPARKQWCDSVISQFNSGANDINQPAMMALPITPYRAQ